MQSHIQQIFLTNTDAAVDLVDCAHVHDALRQPCTVRLLRRSPGQLYWEVRPLTRLPSPVRFPVRFPVRCPLRCPLSPCQPKGELACSARSCLASAVVRNRKPPSQPLKSPLRCPLRCTLTRQSLVRNSILTLMSDSRILSVHGPAMLPTRLIGH